MNNIVRELTQNIIKKLIPNKVVIIFGARRVGKTVLANQILNQIDEPILRLNGEDINTHIALEKRSLVNLKNLLGSKRFLFIDEAQYIPDIGLKLKLMIDNIEGLRVLVTGSSAFDLYKDVGEPLTGRKFDFKLFPISEKEFDQLETPIAKIENIKQRLVFGCYPELLQMTDSVDKIQYLNEMLSAYLLKDILVFENIKNSHSIFNLLKLIAFQIGGEVSMQELGKQLGISKNTVDKYLNLLEKVFILYRVNGFSRNLRKEITKNSRWYFFDNGLRNAIISNFNPIESRNDLGALWENYMISERLKHQEYNRLFSNNYFWRTYDQQEIDWIEERDARIFGYEFKWKKTKVKIPRQWANAYPDATFEVITKDNYTNWLS